MTIGKTIVFYSTYNQCTIETMVYYRIDTNIVRILCYVYSLLNRNCVLGG